MAKPGEHKYKEAGGALPGEFWHLSMDIAGNREFLGYLRNTSAAGTS